MNNQSYQQGWQQLIMKGNSSELASLLGFDDKTLELYRGFIWGHYRSSLKKMFPRLRDAWNMDWHQWCEDYFTAYPPMSWELNELTLNFPNFLSAMADNKNLPPYLAELAHYEVCEFLVYKAQLNIKREFALNSTLHIQQFQHDIASWVKQMDELEAQGKRSELVNTRPKHVPIVLMVVQNPETRLCVFTTASLVDVAIYEVMSQIEIDANHYAAELLAGVQQILPPEHSRNISLKIIENHVEFLRQQWVII